MGKEEHCTYLLERKNIFKERVQVLNSTDKSSSAQEIKRNDFLRVKEIIEEKINRWSLDNLLSKNRR
jgi:hypothetical protein